MRPRRINPVSRRGAAPLALAATVLTVLPLASCGRKGDPLPPLRQVPIAARDLSIHQQGNTLIFRLSYPLTTTSGGRLPGIDQLEIFDLVTHASLDAARTMDRRAYQPTASRFVAIEGAELDSAIVGDRIEARIGLDAATLAAMPTPAAPPEEELEQPEATEAAPRPTVHIFAVRTRSTSGELSDLSNLVPIVLASAFPAPEELRARAQADGVALTWSFSADESVQGFTVYRKLAAERSYGDPVIRLDGAAREYLDQGVELGSRYIYTVRSVASLDPLVESGPAGEREIDYRDIFPPAPPSRVLALAEQGQVRLAIEASPASDVASYVVYRRDPGAAFRRVLETPANRLEVLDTGLVSGLSYTYRVSAVDAAGNEGAPSAEVSVELP